MLYRFVGTAGDPKIVEDIYMEGFVDLSGQESTKVPARHDENFEIVDYTDREPNAPKNDNKW
jgi:hypothetical protein